MVKKDSVSLNWDLEYNTTIDLLRDIGMRVSGGMWQAENMLRVWLMSGVLYQIPPTG